MIECDDSTDGFTGKYIKYIYIYYNRYQYTDQELTHNISIVYLLLYRTCMNMDIPPTTAWISSSYTNTKSIKVKNDYNS